MDKKEYQTPEIKCKLFEITDVILDSTQDQHGNQDGQQFPTDSNGFPE